MQNNLDEFHALVDFVAPGALGERAAFRRDVAAPIEAARDAAAGAAAQRAGAARAEELADKARAWLLRRTAEVNYKCGAQTQRVAHAASLISTYTASQAPASAPGLHRLLPPVGGAGRDV